MTSTAPFARALAEASLPAAVVDVRAFDANLRHLMESTGVVPLRVATKSVRCHALLQRAARALGSRFAGLMSVSPREALALAELGWRDQLIAYPVARRADALPLVGLARLGTPARQVVDAPHHVDLLEALAAEHAVQLPVVIDIDASTRVAGAHLGVRRSPIREPDQALGLLQKIEESPHLFCEGLQFYEAQIAGLSDHPGAGKGLVTRWVKRQARPDVLARRRAFVEALGVPGLVNGGGTGSAAWTARDPSVTEVTIGSGLFAPHLFDGYDGLSLEPAAFAALPVTRRPADDIVTVHGGGYPASGALGADRAPQIAGPEGLSPTSTEGFGEVQTPLSEARPGSVSPGEIVLIRHAKAGELLERFSRVHLVEGDRIVAVAPSFRGHGIELG